MTHRKLILTLLAPLVFLTGVSQTLAAQPIIKDRKKASRLRPPAGSFDRIDAIETQATLPRTYRKGWVPNLSFYSRFASIPGGVMKLFFADYQPLYSASAGVALELGDPRLRTITIELDWTGLNFQPGNWRAKAKPPSEAEYTELELQMISIDATYRSTVHLEGKLDFFYGGGLGIAVLAGKAETTDVLPTCLEPVSQCQHWRNVTRGPFLPTRVIPVVHLTMGLQLEVAKNVFTRLQLGFRNVFYAGLSAGFAL